jgi:hypothetical protein
MPDTGPSVVGAADLCALRTIAKAQFKALQWWWGAWGSNPEPTD